MFLALCAQNTSLDSDGKAAMLVAKTPVTQTVAVTVAKPAPAPAHQWPDQIVSPMLFGGGAGE
jgi:hypothetical protein